METTKNDLCFDQMKLDYESLIDSCKIAISQVKESIKNEISNIDYKLIYKNIDSSLYSSANRIKALSRQLAIVTETYYTLIQGLSREDKKLINFEKLDCKNYNKKE